MCFGDEYSTKQKVFARFFRDGEAFHFQYYLVENENIIAYNTMNGKGQIII